MSGSVSLLTLRSQVRKRADIENETVRHTDAEVNRYINMAWNELYDLITSTNTDLFNTTYSFPTVAGTSVYALPTGFYLLRTANIVQNSWTYELSALNLSELDSYNNYGQVYAGSPSGYAFLGSNLQLVPTPTSVYTVTIRYVPLPTDMVADSDTIPMQAGWEEYVIWKATALIQAIDKRDSGEANQGWQFQRQRILEAAQRRNMHEAKSVIRRAAWGGLPRIGRWR